MTTENEFDPTRDHRTFHQACEGCQDYQERKGRCHLFNRTGEMERQFKIFAHEMICTKYSRWRHYPHPETSDAD